MSCCHLHNSSVHSNKALPIKLLIWSPWTFLELQNCMSLLPQINSRLPNFTICAAVVYVLGPRSPYILLAMRKLIFFFLTRNSAIMASTWLCIGTFSHMAKKR